MRSPLPEPLDRRPFHVREGRALDVGRDRMLGRDLQRPFRGVRTAVTVEPARAYAARMTTGQYFSHVTAAGLHGLPLPRMVRDDPLVDVSVVTPARPPRAAGVRGHRSEPGLVRVDRLDDLPVASPADTWCALATRLSVDQLVVAGDALVRRRHPLCTIGELGRSVRARAGHRGIAALRVALSLVRPRTDSVQESRLRLLLGRAGLPDPAVNGEVRNEYGALIGHGDLVFAEFGVIVEFEGRQHAEDEKQFEYDIERYDDMAAARHRVVRISRAMLEQRTPAVARVTAALTERGWRRGVTQ